MGNVLYRFGYGLSNGGLSPHLQLEAFEHVTLLPGQTKSVTFQVHPRQLSEVDANGVRSVQPGKYKLSVGGSQPDDKTRLKRFLQES